MSASKAIVLDLKPIVNASSAERAELIDVVEGCASFYQLVEGRPADAPRLVNELLSKIELPVAWPVERYLYQIVSGSQVIGLIDVLRGWKSQRQCMIGLLLVRESCQGKGAGANAVHLLHDVISTWQEVETVRIGVAVNNVNALRFWQRCGFVATGEIAQIAGTICDVALFEMPVQKSRN